MGIQKSFFLCICWLIVFSLPLQAPAQARLATELAPVIEESQYCKSLVDKESKCKPIVEYWDRMVSALRVYAKLLKAAPSRRAIGSDSAASATQPIENSKDISIDDIETVVDAQTAMQINVNRFYAAKSERRDHRAAQNGATFPEPAHLKDNNHDCNDIQFDYQVCSGILNQALKKRGFKGFGETITLRRSGWDEVTYNKADWVTVEDKVRRNLDRRKSEKRGREIDLNLRRIPPTGWAR